MLVRVPRAATHYSPFFRAIRETIWVESLVGVLALQSSFKRWSCTGKKERDVFASLIPQELIRSDLLPLK